MEALPIPLHPPPNPKGLSPTGCFLTLTQGDSPCPWWMESWPSSHLSTHLDLFQDVLHKSINCPSQTLFSILFSSPCAKCFFALSRELPSIWQNQLNWPCAHGWSMAGWHQGCSLWPQTKISLDGKQTASNCPISGKEHDLGLFHLSL